MSAWSSTCAGWMNGCPARANPKRRSATALLSIPQEGAHRASSYPVAPAKPGNHTNGPWNMGPRLRSRTWVYPSSAVYMLAEVGWIRLRLTTAANVMRADQPDVASLAARHVQAGIVELQGLVADRRVDLAAVDAGCVDAGLRKFIPSVLGALVDENVVVDPAGNDVKLGVRNISRGEFGVVLGRRLGIAGADRNVGRHGELAQPGFIHAEGLHDAGRHCEHRLDPRVVHVERGGGVERQLVAQIFRHHRIVAPAALEGEVLVGIDPRAADPNRREAALRMAGDADPVRVDRLAPEWVVQQEADAEGDIARALPELVREVGNRRVVGVGAVMVERGHDIAARSQKLGEPGVIEPVAAAPVGEHDERMFRAAECWVGILVKIEIAEERHDKRAGGPLADRRGIEHPQRQMAAALVRVDVVEFSDPDWKSGAALRALRERCSGRRRQQRAGERGDAPGARPPLHAGKKN